MNEVDASTIQYFFYTMDNRTPVREKFADNTDKYTWSEVQGAWSGGIALIFPVFGKSPK